MNAGTARRHQTDGSTAQYARLPSCAWKLAGTVVKKSRPVSRLQSDARPDRRDAVNRPLPPGTCSTPAGEFQPGAHANGICERGADGWLFPSMEKANMVSLSRLTRFVHADIGTHRGTATVTVRFTRQFLAANTEARFRRSIFNTRQLRQFFDYRIDNVVELRPVHFTSARCCAGSAASASFPASRCCCRSTPGHKLEETLCGLRC